MTAGPLPRWPTAQHELAGAVEDLAGAFALQPLLERILQRAVGLLGGAAGSVCTVDEVAGTYRKEADLGVACRQGSVFPLAEGTTGAVVARRGPVVFERYADVPGGHLTADERARMLATVAVPIEWGGAIIGSCVVFSDDPRTRWDAADVELLQLFAGHAAVAIANARLHEAAAVRDRRLAVETERARAAHDVHDTLLRTLGQVLDELDSPPADDSAAARAVQLDAVAAAARTALVDARRAVLSPAGVAAGRPLADAVAAEVAWLRATSRIETDLVVTGDPGVLDARTGALALEALREVLGNAAAHSGATQVRVGVLAGRTGLTVRVSDNGRGFDAPASVRSGLDRVIAQVDAADGTYAVESAPHWGTRVRIELPGPAATPDSATATPVRVLVVDPRPVVRAGVVRLLTAQPGVTVVGETADAADARRHRARQPDVVLVGGSTHGPGEALALVGEAVPAAALIALCDGPLAPTALAALAAAGHGAAPLDVEADALVRAVVAAAAGEVVLTVPASSGPGVAVPDPEVTALRTRLTARERQVVDLVGRGLPDKQVARELAISVKTVEKHVGAALRKSGLPNRVSLATRLANPLVPRAARAG